MKPSTASDNPAATKSQKAAVMRSARMSQIASGTDRSRAKVMRLATLTRGGSRMRRSDARLEHPIGILPRERQIALGERRAKLIRRAEIMDGDPRLLAVEREELAALDDGKLRQPVAHLD